LPSVEELLTFENAEKDYGSRKIGPVSFSVSAGEIVGLLGPNGSGKSTSIRMALGLSRPTAGAVRLFGLDPLRKHTAALAAVGYSPELPNLQTFMTPRSLLELVGRELGLSGQAGREQVPSLLEEVGLIAYADFRIGKLSKGMVQRLSIAQAMMGRPRMLILDEPIIGIDPAGASHFRSVFRRFVEGGGTIILSSHIMSEVESLCTKVVMIHSGKLLFSGTTEEFVRTALDSRQVVVEVGRSEMSVADIIKGVSGVMSVSSTPTGFAVETEKGSDVRGDISRAIVGAGVELLSIGYSRTELEAAYVASLKGSGV